MKKADLIKEIKTKIEAIETILAGIKGVSMSEKPTGAELVADRAFIDLRVALDDLKKIIEVV